MACARFAAASLLALVFASSALADNSPSPVSATSSPSGLKAFLLRADEQAGHTFSRTPAFAWQPVRGALSYEFELATSQRFADNAIVYGEVGLKSPVESVPIELPWSSGMDYSLYAHVRAITRNGPTAWSTPYGFAMRWTSVPQPLLPGYPGLLRWTTVPGATAYQVWEIDTGKIFTTLTNVADEREYYTFHQDPAWTSAVHWRVRAIRNVPVATTPNGMPITKYGPWSPIYTSVNPPFAVGGLSTIGTVSDVVSDSLTQRAHRLMPAFVYSGNLSLAGTPEELYHVYVFTDQDCLNMVYNGSIVGSPAYAPRTTGALAMPGTLTDIATARSSYLGDGDPGAIFTYDNQRIVPTDVGSTATYPPIDLWDTDWPSGRYYWTVMPVEAKTSQDVATTLTSAAAIGSGTLFVGNAGGFAPGDQLNLGQNATQETVVVTAIAGNTLTIGGGTRFFHPAGDRVAKPAGQIAYHDTELAQDACRAGRVLTFGKSSEPVVTATRAPYVSGLSPNGKLVAAKRSRPTIYGPPLVAWAPALSAVDYEIQWSNSPDSFPKANDKVTQATSFVLPVGYGTWYYRVRGLNYAVPTRPQMSWSDTVALRVTQPQFRIVR
ncbi:MAG TPA: hypothetical protein VF002_02550 [Gaiellaceae bacterium]